MSMAVKTVAADDAARERLFASEVPVTRADARSLAVPVSVLLVLAGSAMQGYANGTVDALFVAFMLLLGGGMLNHLVFPRGGAERRAFLLTYGTCIFVGGAVQWYSLATFGSPQSTKDAIGFYNAIFDDPLQYYTWRELNRLWLNDLYYAGLGAPLAVAAWQGVYHVRWLMGLDFGPYLGVMFNALLIAWTSSVTVRTAREIFGDDTWRLRRVGTLYALCGLFILFGALFLRDSFTTFFNALVLWGILRWLSRPVLTNFMFAAALSAVSVAAMVYVRERAVVLFGLYWALAFACWFLTRRFDLMRFTVASVGLLAVVFGSTYFIDYVELSQSLQVKHMTQYETILEDSSREDSLAIRLVVDQPLPVRLILGTGSMMIFPIPLWAYFYDRVGEYHLIKGYHGVYQVLVMPLVLAGFLAAAASRQSNQNRSFPLVFLALYLAMNVAAVVATSLEQRHIGQFMPAFVILAAVVDTRNEFARAQVRMIAIIWLLVVVCVHLAWFISALGR